MAGVGVGMMGTATFGLGCIGTLRLMQMLVLRLRPLRRAGSYVVGITRVLCVGHDGQLRWTTSGGRGDMLVDPSAGREGGA